MKIKIKSSVLRNRDLAYQSVRYAGQRFVVLFFILFLGCIAQVRAATTATLPNAYLSQPYSYSISPIASDCYQINNATLPGSIPGISVTYDAATCTFSVAGTPTGAATTATYSLDYYTDSSLTTTGTVNFVFTIVGSPSVTGVSPSNGPPAGGTSVTISGTNFTGATAVTFGGTAAGGVTVNSSTSITAISPAHAAGIVDVVVTNPAGIGFFSSAFTYASSPLISGVSPSSGSISGGTNVTISGINLSNASSVTFGGIAATIAANTASSITVTTPAHTAGLVDVVVTTSAGTTTSSGAFTYLGTALSAVTPSNGTISGGTSVTIRGSNLSNASSVTFGGSAATITANTATSITVTTPAHAAGSVNLVVTTSLGTSTLNNAFTYQERADPSLNATVVATVQAQAQAVRSFSSAQLNNFSQRLNSLHGNGWASSNFGLSVNTADASDETAWTRQADTVNYKNDFSGASNYQRLQKNLHRTALMIGAANVPADPVLDSLPNLASTTDQQRRSLALWIAGSVDWGKQKAGTKDNPRFQTNGVSLGGDYRLSDTLTLGLGAGYSANTTDTDGDGSRSVGRGVSFIGYGSLRLTKQWYIDGLIGYGSLNFDLTRYLGDSADFAYGSRDGHLAFASLSSGYEFTGQSWLLAPYAKLDLMTASLNQYTETTSAASSSSALTYYRQTIHSNDASLGVRGQMRFALNAGILVPELQLAYQHSLQGTGRAGIAYADLASAGAAYYVTDTSNDSSQWLASVGVKLLLKNDFTLSLYYLHSIANSLLSSQSVRFSVAGRF